MAFEMLAAVFTLLGAVGVGVGAYLLHDGFRAHDLVGKATTGLSFLELVIVGAITEQRQAAARSDCMVFNEKCDEITTFQDFIVGSFVRPLVITGIAHGIGWAVAKATRRKPAEDSESGELPWVGGAKTTARGIDVESSTKAELYERAKELGVEGRSKMNKCELAEAVRRKV